MTFSNLSNEEWFSLNAHKFDNDTYNRLKDVFAELKDVKDTEYFLEVRVKELEEEIEELEWEGYAAMRKITKLNTEVCELKKQLETLMNFRALIREPASKRDLVQELRRREVRFYVILVVAVYPLWQQIFNLPKFW